MTLKASFNALADGVNVHQLKDNPPNIHEDEIHRKCTTSPINSPFIQIGNANNLFFLKRSKKLINGEIMSKRKVFNITDLNNEDVIQLQQITKEHGARIEQAGIINLALELFFRDKQDDFSNILEVMKREHRI